MKTIKITFLFLLGMSFVALVQNPMNEGSIKETIRDLEMREARAVVDHNLDELKTLWAEDFMVNNPFNQVMNGRQEVLGLIESGFINYSSFEREIESMMILDDTVIVMGRESIMPIGGGNEAGITIQRRYTNIWKMENGKWQVRARHANIICANQD